MLFHRFCTDQEIASQNRIVRTATSSKNFMERLSLDNKARGFGCCAAEEITTGTTIGLIGVHPGWIPVLSDESSLQIVWWLAPEYRGKYYATEGALAWLDFAFGTLGLSEVVSFANCNDNRSIAVMERIGMRRDFEGDFHQKQASTSSGSSRLLYRIARQDWGGPVEKLEALASRLLTCEMTVATKERQLSVKATELPVEEIFITNNLALQLDIWSLEFDLFQNIFEDEQQTEIENIKKAIESTRLLFSPPQ